MTVLIGVLTIIGTAIGMAILAVKLSQIAVKPDRMDQRWLERQWLAEHREDES